MKHTTLLSALLLDLFGKSLAKKLGKPTSWTSHVSGALSLVKLRGLEQVQNPSEAQVLVRLANHYISSSISSASIVPEELFHVQAHVWKRLNLRSLSLKLSETMAQYARMCHDLKNGQLSPDEHVNLCEVLDAKLFALEQSAPPSWAHSSTVLLGHFEHAFEMHYDTYANRNICHAWNTIRLVRLLLNDCILEYYSIAPANDTAVLLSETPQSNLQTIVSNKCASAAQYIDCSDAARGLLPPSEDSDSRLHTGAISHLK